MNVYDSLFNDLDNATDRLINNMFGTNDAYEVSLKKVQVQAGVKTTEHLRWLLSLLLSKEKSHVMCCTSWKIYVNVLLKHCVFLTIPNFVCITILKA